MFNFSKCFCSCSSLSWPFPPALILFSVHTFYLHGLTMKMQIKYTFIEIFFVLKFFLSFLSVSYGSILKSQILSPLYLTLLHLSFSCLPYPLCNYHLPFFAFLNISPLSLFSPAVFFSLFPQPSRSPFVPYYLEIPSLLHPIAPSPTPPTVKSNRRTTSRVTSQCGSREQARSADRT